MQTLATDSLAQIKKIDFFEPLDETFQQELASRLERVSVVPDEFLCHQGDPGDDGLYIIIDGHLRVLVSRPDGSEMVVDEHQSGSFLGEIAMLTGSRRTASIQAVTNTEVAKISKATFDELVEQHPGILDEVSQIVLRRLRRPQLIATLTHLFGTLDMATFEDIQTELSWVNLHRGERLIHQGEMDNNLYVLVSGRLQAVARDETGKEEAVGEIVVGESVGEMQILTGDPRSVSVDAIRDSRLVKLSKAGFDRLVIKYPQMMHHISKLVIKRLQHSMRASAENRSNLALDIVLVPTSPDVPLAEFTQRLAAAIEKFGPTLVLDSHTLDNYLGMPGASQSPIEDPNDIRLAVWLSEQANHYSFNLYQTDFSVTPWTQRCLRHADQILLVGHADGDPTTTEIEFELIIQDTEQAMVRKHLVLLHPNGNTLPTGTKQWLDQHQIHHHHHVRWDQDRDFRGLARFLTRRAVGLVLGSGGARGFAHIGTIRAIEALGLEIDLVGGSSFGSLVGGLYAMGYDYQTLYDKSKQLTNPKFISDYTIPITSFMAGGKFTGLMKRLYGDHQIEDTWRNFFCVTTSLTRGAQNIHLEGPMWQHIRSSCSLPLIFPPLLDKSELLADGGLMNTVPLDVMRHLAEGGFVIGVDVSVEEDLNDHYDFGHSLSGWQILWSRINPFAKTVKSPSLIPILMRVSELQSSSRRKAQSGLADLYIRPPVDNIGTMDFQAYEQIIEFGYRETMVKLEQWMSEQQ